MTKSIVSRPLVRILQHLIGMGDLLEHLLRLLVARILVRVILHRLLAIRLLEILLGGSLGDAQQFVVVLFGHGCWLTDSDAGLAASHRFVVPKPPGQLDASDFFAEAPLEMTTLAGRRTRPLRL